MPGGPLALAVDSLTRRIEHISYPNIHASLGMLIREPASLANSSAAKLAALHIPSLGDPIYRCHMNGISDRDCHFRVRYGYRSCP